jgi:PRC-barrel domain
MATEAWETAGLIGSDKVEGTPVYDAKGEKIGSIERVMIDKRSGQVAYAVLRFGGFLGIGSDYYPIPWASLNYDTSLGGYRLDITEEQLKGAPKYEGDSLIVPHCSMSPKFLKLLGSSPCLRPGLSLAAVGHYTLPPVVFIS